MQAYGRASVRACGRAGVPRGTRKLWVRTPFSPVKERVRERDKERARGREKERDKERERDDGSFKRNDGCLGTF